MAAVRLPHVVTAGLPGLFRGFRGWEIWSERRPVRSYVLAVVLLAVSAAAAEVAAASWTLADVAEFAAIVACGAVAIESTRGVKEAHGALVGDMQTVWFLALAITLPAWYAMIAPAFLTAYKLRRQPGLVAYRRVFSSATISLAYGGAAVAFHAVPHSLAGPAPGTGSHVLTWTAAVAGCGLLAWLINNALLIPAVRLHDPTASVRALLANRDSASNDLIELSLAVLASLAIATSPFLLVLLLPSVLLYRRYLMHAQLRAESRIDAGTGVLNAGSWQREASVELSRALRTGSSAAVAVIGIDHFGAVHESVGPSGGDRVLRAIAASMTGQLRDYDLVGRLRAEEFVIFFPHTGEQEARRITERLRDRVGGEAITIDAASSAGYVFRLTACTGVAVLNGTARDLDGLLTEAAAALETARRGRRERALRLAVSASRAGVSSGGQHGRRAGTVTARSRHR